MRFPNELDFKGQYEILASTFSSVVRTIAELQVPHFKEFFPFKPSFSFKYHHDNDFICFQVKTKATSVPSVGELTSKEIIDIARILFKETQQPSYDITFDRLKDSGFCFDLFTYIGNVNDNKVSAQHITTNVYDWINNIVLPSIEEQNSKRIMEGMRSFPSYDVEKLLENTYVIESEAGLLQGTAFHLEKVGIVTCDHCLRNEETGQLLEDIKIYKGSNHGKKWPIEIVKSNKDIDIAILNSQELPLSNGLEIGSADNLKINDRIAIVGFPNYNFGDSGIFNQGYITGFRMHSGIRHILVSMSIISGNSGGPIFDENSRVVGIAVTGAEKMYKALETEKHGAIPIDALKILSSSLW